ncbi:hypothetical protein FACS1894214_1980 [Planctomycetales bacterium]|nr:hypothetical protein FACS1894214_1980 [Planctomycetales bacterium]
MTAREEKLVYVRERITQLRAFLLSAMPVSSVSQDGMSVAFDRAGAREELKELEKEEQRLLNPGGWLKSIDLSHSF